MDLMKESKFMNMKPEEQKKYLIAFMESLPEEEAQRLCQFLMEDDEYVREFDKNMESARQIGSREKETDESD